MTSITASDLLTIIFALADDWYQAHGTRYLKGKPGAKPEFSYNEVITLLLAMDFIPFPSETQFLGFIRANSLALFPRLIDQSSSTAVQELYACWSKNCGMPGWSSWMFFSTPTISWIPSPCRRGGQAFQSPQ